MYFLNMLHNIATRFSASFTHVFHKKRKGQVVQKSASFCLDEFDEYDD